MILLCFAHRHSVAEEQLGREHDFTFVRLQYDSAGGYFDSRYGSWSTDHPAADLNFLRGVIRLTNIRADPEPLVLRLDDERLFTHTFLYGLEMGRNGGIVLNEKEIENLRDFLLRGGFLFIDDFWGTYQWEIFHRTFSKVFPDRKLQELKSDHPIFHSFYDIDGPQMIPAVGNVFNAPEQDVAMASNHAILDNDGRVMVLINWNSDIGDGWEHTYHPDYPTEYANMAYQLGINYLIYALTH